MSGDVMFRVWRESPQSGAALLVLLAIADIADDTGIAYPSVATLAERGRTSARNVQIVCDKLVAAGELAVDRGAGPHGCNVYRVLFAGGEKSSGVKNLRGEKSSGVKNLRGSQDSENGASTPVEGGENSSGVKNLHPKVGRLGIDQSLPVEDQPTYLPAVTADPHAPAPESAPARVVGGVAGADALAAHRGFVAFDPHNSAPLSDDAARSFALLTDREVGIDPIMARRLAEMREFDEIARQVFQARRDIEAGSLRSFGVLINRLLRRTSATITPADRQSALYLRHCGSPYEAAASAASDPAAVRAEILAQRAAAASPAIAGDPDLAAVLSADWADRVASVERAGDVDGVPLVRVVGRVAGDGWLRVKGSVAIRRALSHVFGNGVVMVEVAA